MSLLISIITLERDKNNRGYDMLHNALILINNLNLKLTDYMKLKKPNKEEQKQINTLRTEYINQYCYLAFLVNNKQIRDSVAYRIGHKFILKMFAKFKPILNKDNHEEIFILVRRWEKYPPISIKNRFMAWLEGY